MLLNRTCWKYWIESIEISLESSYKIICYLIKLSEISQQSSLKNMLLDRTCWIINQKFLEINMLLDRSYWHITDKYHKRKSQRNLCCNEDHWIIRDWTQSGLSFKSQRLRMLSHTNELYAWMFSVTTMYLSLTNVTKH